MASNFAAHVAKGHDLATQVQEFTPGTDSNEPFIYGDFVYIDIADNGQVKRCAADPTLIAGISEVDSIEAVKLTENGRAPVRILTGSDVRIFLSSATTPSYASHVGNSYGITRHSNGHWQLDVAKTTTSSRVRVVAVYPAEGIFECVIHQNLLQFADATVATA